MSVPLFRTSILRSIQILNGSLSNVSRSVGTANGNLLARATVVLPSHSLPLRSRNFTTTFAVTTPAAKSASAEKTTTKTKGRTVSKKTATPKKTAASKKKGTTTKTAASKKKLLATKKKPAKKVVPKAPRIFKKNWIPPFKRPLNAWAKFVSESSKAADQPTIFKDHLRVASLEWKNMSEEQKSAYAPSPSELEEYSRKLAEWNASLPKPVQVAKRKYKRSRRGQTPPSALSPIAQFVKEQFHVAQFPAEVTTVPHKFQHLAHVFATDLSQAEKTALKDRAAEEFSKKTAAGT